jgi:hypothetical protein
MMNHNIKEQVYDAQIQPLVEQIAAISKEHDISLVIAADIGRNEFDRPQVASTILLFENSHNTFWNIKRILFDGYKVVPPPKEENFIDDFNLNDNDDKNQAE